jgi:ArsR family transcriptional regulator, arsenate/arsenite/antimonite-responsive transcriptional repressor
MSRHLAVDLRPMARMFKALGDDTRLRIVALLTQGELCVCHLEDVLEVPQPNVSRHLAILRTAGLVEARREGTWMHYSLAEREDPECAHQIDALCKQFGNRKLLKRDLEKLVNLRGRRDCD